ncbi:MAG: SpoVG family protein [Bacilli bacterium]|nr:SpoVG family protein [Bacilli bacterium]
MNNLEITSIRVKKLPKKENSDVVGTASIVLNKAFLVKDIKIIQTKKRLFCGMPSKKLEDGSFVDICNSLNSKLRKYIENSILAEYINADYDAMEDLKKEFENDGGAK